jgi:polyisoprenoid-binding protein YceI
MKKIALIAGALLMTSTPAMADDLFGLPTNVYNISVDKSLIYVVTRKDTNTMGSGLSHDHAVRATDFSGSIGWNNGDASKCNFDITVQVSGLENDASDMRRTAGLTDDLNDDMRGKVKKAMLADDQLDLANHPTMSFKSSGCALKSGREFAVTGNMMIRGKAAQVTIPMSINADGATFSAVGSFSVNGSDFGVKPKSAAAGQIKNLDQWTFTINIGASK